MKTIKTDVCVIGGGSGGLSFAAGAVQMGAIFGQIFIKIKVVLT